MHRLAILGIAGTPELIINFGKGGITAKPIVFISIYGSKFYS